MLLFRSEQHVDRWCKQWNRTRGGLLTLEQGWLLAQLFYGNRFEENWRPVTLEESKAIFERVGMTGEFWELG